MSKNLEVVLYAAQGRTQPALVLNSREGEVSHLGANDEPLLTLAIIKQPALNAPHKRPTALQAAVATPEVEIVHDVVHASHEFDDEFKKKHGASVADIATHRGHGEWTEYEGDEAQTISGLRQKLSLVTRDCNLAQDGFAKQRARAELAESVSESLRKEVAALRFEKSGPDAPAV